MKEGDIILTPLQQADGVTKRIVPIYAKHVNRTVLGCDPGSVQVKGDLTTPAMPEAEWRMHGKVVPAVQPDPD